MVNRDLQEFMQHHLLTKNSSIQKVLIKLLHIGELIIIEKINMVLKTNSDSIDLGGFTIGQWKKKREILKSNLDYSDEWKEAVDWYNNRLKIRYFDPMKRIEEQAIGEGFSLATIHCALIEHFASISQGKIHNCKKNNTSPNYEYKSSSNHFQDFLENSNMFKEYFSFQSDIAPMFDAKDFYANVRCALLHEACTKNNWRINTLSCGYANPDKKIMTIESGNVKRLFRDVLTIKLSDFLEDYKSYLKSDKKLRLYFARKIDHLCEITPDKINYEWWKDL